MKFIARKFFLVMLISSYAAYTSADTKCDYIKDVEDPFFLVSINTSKLEKYKLEDGEKPMSSGRYWLLANYDVDNLSYQIILGYIPIYSDTDPPTFEGCNTDMGTVYIHNKVSNMDLALGTIDVIFDEGCNDPSLSKEILRGLAKSYISNIDDIIDNPSHLRSSEIIESLKESSYTEFLWVLESKSGQSR